MNLLFVSLLMLAEPSVSARLSPDPSNIGDVLTYEVVASYPQGMAVNLPSGLSLAPLHIVSTQESAPEPTGEGMRKTFTIELQHFATGEAEVPSFPLTYVTDDNEVRTVDVPAHAFAVDALLANEAQPERKPEDPPVSIEYPNELAEIVIYAVLATMLFALGAFFLLRHLLRAEKFVVPPPPAPAHEVALAALEELEGGELLANRRFQDYYVQLTEIAKGYIQGRFRVEALDRTTDEIRADLLRDEERIAPLSATTVIAFLDGCDLVKFARVEPETEEAEEALAEVRTMVTETIPESPKVQEKKKS